MHILLKSNILEMSTADSVPPFDIFLFFFHDESLLEHDILGKNITKIFILTNKKKYFFGEK